MRNNLLPSKKKIQILFTTFIVCLCLIQPTIAQNKVITTTTDSAKAFTLGEVTVVSNQQAIINNRINADKIEEQNRLTVSSALNLLPGITQSNVGPRNESMIYIRGYDLRQIPLYVDGVPIYVPYDGYVDLGRFTTFDLSSIKVEKGYSSVIYGPNALGGAINLISKKPTDKFELNGASGFISGGYRTNLNIGSNLGKFYIQAGISQLKRDYINLSEKFDSVKNENGGRRDNSYNNDFKYNIKVAYTPNNTDEYAVSYINQQGEKGTPVYAGEDVLNSLYSKPRFWQWPKWNKESIYFISKTKIDKHSYIKTRAYYDKFTNELFSYDSSDYTTQTKPYAFQSYYNDHTIGASAEYGTTIIPNNDLKIAVHFKQDVHKENNLGEPVRTLSDNTFSLGAEDVYKISSKLNASAGISYNVRKSIKAQDYNSTTHIITDYPSNTNDAINIQAGLAYEIKANNKIFATVSRKTRFATSKDRYSYRLGTAIPNTDLHAETAINYEVGYATFLSDKLKIEGSIFYNHINDIIQMVDNVQYDNVNNKWLSQSQNAGKSAFYGIEASIEYQLSKHLNAGINYTYLQRENISNPDIKFTNVPNNKLFGFVKYNFLNNAYLMANAEYNSERYSTTYGTTADAFTVVNIKAYSKVWKYFGIDAGINNLFDKNYALTEGYAEQGRNYFISLLYNY